MPDTINVLYDTNGGVNVAGTHTNVVGTINNDNPVVEEDDLVECERCGDDVGRESSEYIQDRFGYEDTYLCQLCYEVECFDEDDDEEEEISLPTIENSDDTGDCPTLTDEDVIASVDKSITFGIEFEMVDGKENHLKEYARSIGFNYTADGSIQGNKAVEFQTAILKGKRGALSVLGFLEKANELEHHVNSTCGTHVHLGALDFFDTFEFTLSTIAESEGKEKIVVERVLLLNILEAMGEESTNQWLNDMYMRGQSGGGYSSTYRMRNGKISRYSIVKIYLMGENGRYYSYNYVIRDSQLEKFDRTSSDIIEGNRSFVCGIRKNGDRETNIYIKGEDVSIYARERSEKYHKLKTLFYTYTLFEKLFFAMLPESRKENNYCNPLATSYTLRDINRCESQEDLELLWYKKNSHVDVARCKQNHYEESRYHSFNLHAMFYKYGTVEIRSHHGTLQAHSILMWVALHQSILNAVLKGKFNFLHNYNHRMSLRSVEDYYKLLIKVLGIQDTPLQKFIKHRVDKYSPKSLTNLNK